MQSAFAAGGGTRRRTDGTGRTQTAPVAGGVGQPDYTGFGGTLLEHRISTTATATPVFPGQFLSRRHHAERRRVRYPLLVQRCRVRVPSNRLWPVHSRRGSSTYTFVFPARRLAWAAECQGINGHLQLQCRCPQHNLRRGRKRLPVIVRFARPVRTDRHVAGWLCRHRTASPLTKSRRARVATSKALWALLVLTTTTAATLCLSGCGFGRSSQFSCGTDRPA